MGAVYFTDTDALGSRRATTSENETQIRDWLRKGLIPDDPKIVAKYASPAPVPQPEQPATRPEPVPQEERTAGPPDELLGLSRFVAWKHDKGRKPPITASGIPDKKWNEPESWLDYQPAVDRSAKGNGIGIVLGPGSGLSGIDLDGCRDKETGEVDPRAQAIIEIAGSYTEVSPSGLGLKVFGKGNGDWLEMTFLKGFVKVERKSVGYFTITEDGPTVPLVELNLDVIEEQFPQKAKKERKPKKSALPEDGGTIPPGSQDGWLTARAGHYAAKGRTVDEIPDLLRVDIKHRCLLEGDDWTDAQLLSKAESAVRKFEGVAEEPLAVEDFFGYMPTHQYIYRPTREFWPQGSVDARVPKTETSDGKGVPAHVLIDKLRPVEQMTWWPGKDELIKDQLCAGGAWIQKPGARVYNTYLGPIPAPGDSAKAEPWLKQLKRIYPDDWAHILGWFAYRVQHPAVKINHALLLGGAPGIGKDSIVEGVLDAVGRWNVQEVSPAAVMGRFNGFVKSVILRISEARDLGDLDRYSFYEHMKTYLAAPPDVILVDEKHLREYPVPNVCGVVITTNNKTNGIYLPGDDRRHYVAWTDAQPGDVSEQEWTDFYNWLEDGGRGHVTAFLKELNLKSFNPKAPPKKTDAFWEIVNSNRAPEDDELGDAIEALGNPDVLTLEDVLSTATADLSEWLTDRKNRRRAGHRFEAVGYSPVRNPDEKSGRWRVPVPGGKTVKRTVYGKKELSVRERHVAVGTFLASGPRGRKEEL